MESESNERPLLDGMSHNNIHEDTFVSKESRQEGTPHGASGLQKTVTDRPSLNNEHQRQESVTLDNHPMTRVRILKNIAMISLAFLLLFTAYMSLLNLQSSINMEAGLGTVGLAIIYGARMVSCILLPPFLISHLGCKWTMALAMFFYLGYMAANFYATWGTIVPGSIVLGFSAGPLWTTLSSYITVLGREYSSQTGTSAKDATSKFFGFFYALYQSAYIWGNLLSSLILQGRTQSLQLVNETVEEMVSCGALFCPTKAGNNTNLIRPSNEKIYAFGGIDIACGFLGAMIIVLFVDKVDLHSENDENGEKSSPSAGKLLKSSLSLLGKSRFLQMLLPISIYSGIAQAYISGDFTVAFVSCPVGIEYVGYVMMCFGAVSALFSIIVGKLVNHVGQLSLFILGFCAHGGVLVTLLVWRPDPDVEYVPYILAAIWGVGSAVFRTNIPVLYGRLFHSHTTSAFAVFRLAESLGWSATFAYSSFLCTDVKTYICLSFLCSGTLLLVIIKIRSRQRKQMDTSDLGNSENQNMELIITPVNLKEDREDNDT